MMGEKDKWIRYLYVLEFHLSVVKGFLRNYRWVIVIF